MAVYELRLGVGFALAFSGCVIVTERPVDTAPPPPPPPAVAPVAAAAAAPVAQPTPAAAPPAGQTQSMPGTSTAAVTNAESLAPTNTAGAAGGAPPAAK